jgi:hypothetical protein
VGEVRAKHLLAFLASAGLSTSWELLLLELAPSDCNAEDCSLVNVLIWVPMIIFPFVLGVTLSTWSHAHPLPVVLSAVCTGGVAAITLVLLEITSWDPFDDRLETLIGGGFLVLLALLSAVTFAATGVFMGARMRTYIRTRQQSP